MSGCSNLLSLNTYNKDSALVADTLNLANFSSRISTVLKCAQKIIPSQGEAVVFEKSNFDSTGKVYFYKINSDNTPVTTNYTSPIEFRSIIVGPFTSFTISGQLRDNTFPLSKHKDIGYKEELVYYAQVKETLTQSSSQTFKIYDLDTIGAYTISKISMADCYTMCDDSMLSGSNMCLSGFRDCVKQKIGTNTGGVLNPQFLIECSRKYWICQKNGGISFPTSNNYNTDYSKICNPVGEYQAKDKSCEFVNKNATTLVPIKGDPFQNLFYYGTFFDLCNSKQCTSFCSNESWQLAWATINRLNIGLKEQTIVANRLQNEINVLKTDYLKKQQATQTILQASQSNLSSYQQEYNDFLTNMAKKKELVINEINIYLSTAQTQQEQRIKALQLQLDLEKQRDIVNANSQFLIREEDYKNRLSKLEQDIATALSDDTINRQNVLNKYNLEQKEGALKIQNAQASLEKTLKDKLNIFVEQNIKDIQTATDLQKSALNTVITKANNEISRINTAITTETQAFEAFKVAIADKMKAIQVAANQTDLLYEKEIDRLNGILQMNNDNNKKTIINTQARYDEQISSLLKLSDTEKKIILQDKNTTVENKMDFLIGKKDLISQDFENKKSVLDTQYEMAIAAQDNLFNTQLADLKKNNDKNINDLINVSKNYKSTISETQTNLNNLQQTYNDRTIKLNNDIKIVQEESINNINKLIKDNEDAKIKLLVDAEKKTQTALQEINDKVTEQQKLAIKSKSYYTVELKKLLIDSENKRIELINNNSKDLEITLNNLQLDYQNKSKDLDSKIKQLEIDKKIIQEEADIKLSAVNKIVSTKEEYSTVYLNSQYKSYSIVFLILVNIILLILKIK
jgi:hypothetical protein